MVRVMDGMHAELEVHRQRSTPAVGRADLARLHSENSDLRREADNLRRELGLARGSIKEGGLLEARVRELEVNKNAVKHHCV